MWASFRAELLVLRKSPVIWALAALLPLDTLIEGYVFSYLFYLRQQQPGADPSGGTPEMLLPQMLPSQFNIVAVAGYAFLGTAVPLVLGAVIAGGDWTRGTLRTSLSQGPGRLRTFSGQALAVAVLLVVSVLVNFTGAAVVSTVLRAVTGGTASPPTARSHPRW